MTTKERRDYLKGRIISKYEQLKYKAVMSYHDGEISADDLRMRKKFLTREENLRLAEIDEMSYDKIKRRYEKLTGNR